MNAEELLAFNRGIEFACQMVVDIVRADEKLRTAKHWPKNSVAVLAFAYGQLNRLKGGAQSGTLKR